jgi:electron transport complex protein RnfG
MQYNISARVNPEKDWKVKKDGGEFDYMAGATITPRAVVKAVRKALSYHEQHRDLLYGAAEGAK